MHGNMNVKKWMYSSIMLYQNLGLFHTSTEIGSSSSNGVFKVYGGLNSTPSLMVSQSHRIHIIRIQARLSNSVQDMNTSMHQ